MRAKKPSRDISGQADIQTMAGVKRAAAYVPGPPGRCPTPKKVAPSIEKGACRQAWRALGLGGGLGILSEVDMRPRSVTGKMRQPARATHATALYRRRWHGSVYSAATETEASARWPSRRAFNSKSVSKR